MTADLTARELEVLAEIANGGGLMGAASRLHISLSTVKTHASRAYRKLGATEAAHAVGIAYRTGLLAVPVNPDREDPSCAGPVQVPGVEGWSCGAKFPREASATSKELP